MQIKILGVKFTIKYMDLSKEDLCGDCDVVRREIRISTHMSPDIQVSTLFHECVHAALGVSGVANQLSEELEENIVVCIEHAFEESIKLTPKSL